jgi:HAD superfamily hydrolase (TIGR01509 family)
MAVAAIFDLDGTLVTFKLDIKEWRRVLLDLLKKRGFDIEGLTLTTPTQDILDRAKKSGTEGNVSYESLRAEAFAILDKMEIDGVATSEVFPDAISTLRLLKAKGVRLCVLTNSGRRAASESLLKSGLGTYFEFVLTRDDIETMKPRPDGLVKAIARLGISPSDSYFVGDSPYDVMAAQQAGVKSVGVATGNYTAEKLKATGADFVIGSISELPVVLGV